MFETSLFLDSQNAQGLSSNFAVHYYPPIELDITKTYELALISAEIWYSWHNVNKTNNKFRYSPDNGTSWIDLTIPPGAYNIEDIGAEIKRLIKSKGHDPDNVTLTANYNTLKSRISLAGNYQVDLRDDKSAGNLRRLLGFTSQLLSQDGDHDGENPVDITSVNSVHIGCSLVSSAYVNGASSNVIQSFSPSVPPGYLMTIQPRYPIYLPITKQSEISALSIRIADQSGKEIDLNGERVTMHLSLREKK